MKLTVLTRAGCHLCDEAMKDLRSHLGSPDYRGPAFEIEEIDLDSDDELHRRYLERIPVIQVGGETVSEIFFEPEEFDAFIIGGPRPNG